jgi:hypothetical protein
LRLKDIKLLTKIKRRSNYDWGKFPKFSVFRKKFLRVAKNITVQAAGNIDRIVSQPTPPTGLARPDKYAASDSRLPGKPTGREGKGET